MLRLCLLCLSERIFDAFKPIRWIDNRQRGTPQHHEAQIPRLVRHIAFFVAHGLGHFVHDEIHQLIKTFERAEHFAASGELDADLLVHVLG